MIGYLALARETFDVEYAESKFKIAKSLLLSLSPDAIGYENLITNDEDADSALSFFNSNDFEKIFLFQTTFTDAKFMHQGRDAVYYVRAIEEPVPTINGGNLRVDFDSKGQAIKSDMCFGDYRMDSNDDCLQMASQRAWSSPIYVDFEE